MWKKTTESASVGVFIPAPLLKSTELMKHHARTARDLKLTASDQLIQRKLIFLGLIISGA